MDLGKAFRNLLRRFVLENRPHARIWTTVVNLYHTHHTRRLHYLVLRQVAFSTKDFMSEWFVNQSWIFVTRLVSVSRKSPRLKRFILLSKYHGIPSVKNLSAKNLSVKRGAATFHIRSAHTNARGLHGWKIAQTLHVSIFLDMNAISHSFRSLENQNRVKYSNGTRYFRIYSSSKFREAYLYITESTPPLRMKHFVFNRLNQKQCH